MITRLKKFFMKKKKNLIKTEEKIFLSVL
jgi:hypothetical protein